MNEKLYEICKEILESEVEAEKFMKMQNVDEIYEYLKIKIPELSKDEFEDFIIDAFEQYKEKCENEQKSGGAIDDDDLGSVAGGVNLGTRIASAGLALMALLPAVGATNKDNEKSGASSGTSISQGIDESEKSIASEKFNKVKTWCKDNAGAIAGVTVGAVALAAAGLKLKKAMPYLKQKKLDHDFISAIEKRNPDKVSKLIKKGANINVKNKEGESAIVVALNVYRDADKLWWFQHPEECRAKSSDIVVKLVEAGADLKNARFSDGSPVTSLVQWYHTDWLKMFLEHGAEVYNTDDPKWRHTSGVRWGIDSKHDLSNIYEKADLNFFKLLLEKDARFDTERGGILKRAVSFGKIDLVKEVLDRGITIPKDLLFDSFSKNDEISKEILKHVNIKYKETIKCLIYAADRGNIRIVKKLLDMGVNINAKDENGKTVLFGRSVIYENILKELIKRGIDINAKDNNGRTALMVSISQGFKYEFEKLLGAGADVNIKDNEGRTALMFASEHGFKYEFEKLLSAGADVNIKDNEGRTALMFASEQGLKYEVENLLKAGADVNAKDNRGRSALTLAKSKDDTDIVGLLIRHGAGDKI